ncbi:LHCP [Ectocarpus sp. CCAP 1310/34]|nr:LHCP [Ectocarpus sp. CCAP 1310/34]
MGGGTMLAFGALPSHVTTTRELRSAGGVLCNIGICPSISRSHQQLPETCRYAVSEMVGASEETGGVFDPLGLATDETSLYRRRVAELKHGRVCMLATVGVLVQSFVQFPDPDRSAFSNTRPLGALFQVWRERPVILLGIVALMGLIELTIGREDYGSSEAEPGKLGELWQTARPEDPQLWRRRQLQELKHGRLASLGITGMLAQELVTHEGPVEQLLKGDINPFHEY